MSYQRKQDLFCVRAEYKPLDPTNASVRGAGLLPHSAVDE